LYPACLTTIKMCYNDAAVEIIFQIILVVFLVLLNGYFVASEFALVAVRKGVRRQGLCKRRRQISTA
jgi:hypothetical protein